MIQLFSRMKALSASNLIKLKSNAVAETFCLQLQKLMAVLLFLPDKQKKLKVLPLVVRLFLSDEQKK